MKLTGYLFSGASGPVESGYLPMGDVTVVLGPNDTGKTRLVEDLARYLGQRLGDADDLRMHRAPAGRGIVFGEFTHDEMARLFERTVKPGEKPRLSSFTRLGVQTRLIDSDRAELRDYPHGSEDAWNLVVDALSDSMQLGFSRADGDDGELAEWAVWWCLPAKKELQGELADAVRETVVPHPPLVTGDA
ncbi:hypothetical protein LCGC14_2747210, partial [marine sediment metagenome]